MKDIIENLLKLQTLEFEESKDAETEARIGELRGQIPSQILGHYDRLVARGKKGVAVVRNQVCTGCHVQVPRGLVVTLMRNDDIQLCESCGRYLYQPESMSPPRSSSPRKNAQRKQEHETLLHVV
jgi:predicted  nucleic acid-binding Zn-ribbon protein